MRSALRVCYIDNIDIRIRNRMLGQNGHLISGRTPFDLATIQV